MLFITIMAIIFLSLGFPRNSSISLLVSFSRWNFPDGFARFQCKENGHYFRKRQCLWPLCYVFLVVAWLPFTRLPHEHGYFAVRWRIPAIVWNQPPLYQVLSSYLLPRFWSPKKREDGPDSVTQFSYVKLPENADSQQQSNLGQFCY